MLPEPLQLGKVDATQLFDYLYGFFYRDFVQNPLTFASQVIDDLIEVGVISGIPLTISPIA
jgi:hypothetical protein